MTARMKTRNPTVLITGASSGIGLELARLFARDGYDLALVARNQSRLEQLAGELESRHPVQVTTLVRNLAENSSPHQIVDLLERQSMEIDVLVNNAGTQVYGEFTQSDLNQQITLMQVNMNAVVRLTHLLASGMARRGYGRILNVGSTGAFAPGPLNAVYCATKAFVVSFSQALGAELSGTGVTVTALCPGATQTAFITRHGMQDVRIFRNAMSPARVAQIGYRAMQKGRPLVVAGFGNRLQVLSFQLMAPFLDLTPPALLKAVGDMFMGRSTSARSIKHLTANGE